MIVGRSKNYTSSDPELNPPIVEGQANPIRRDTVQIPSGQSATLRVVADNPGVWFFHCMFPHFSHFNRIYILFHRSHRMASRIWPRYPACRSASSSSSRCENNLPFYIEFPVCGSGSPLRRKRRWTLQHNRLERPQAGTLPTDIGMATERYRCDDGVRVCGCYGYS